MRKAMSKPAKAKETCAHENRETTIGGGMRCKDCGAVVRGKAAPSPAERCDVRVKIDGGWPSCTLPAGHPLPHSVPGPKPEAASEAPAERCCETDRLGGAIPDAPSPAERMDDAEFERICANVVMLIPPITLVEKYRDEIRCRPQDDTKLIAEARRARQSEAALRAESILPEMQAAQFGENVAEAKFKKAEEENERLATWGAAEQGAHLSWKASSHAAEACVKELLKIIEDAPHGGNCAGFPPHALSEASGTQRPATAGKPPPR